MKKKYEIRRKFRECPDGKRRILKEEENLIYQIIVHFSI